MVAISDRERQVKALTLALTDGITGGHEWVSFHDVRVRMAHDQFSFLESELTEWLSHLESVGKVESKTENGKAYYRLKDEPEALSQSMLSRDEQQPKKTFDPPKRTVSTPPRKEWPGWVKDKFDAMDKEIDKYHNAVHSYKISIEELETSIMEHKTEGARALSIYGSQNALEELTMQVSLSPKFADLTPAEHRYVASTGLSSGLNPEFHLHAWKHTKRVKKGREWVDVEVLMIMPDYKALIATAKDPIMTSERRLTTPEMIERGISEDEVNSGAVAYEVTGTNLKHAIMARQAGIEYTPFKGYGWWASMKEIDNWVDGEGGKRKKQGKKLVPNDTAKGRDGAWMAKKRAIRDLFNQISDLRLKFGQIPGATVVDDTWEFTGDPNTIEGEFVERTADGWNNDAESVKKAESYRDSQGVTDEEINASLACDDWRRSPITSDEWKVIVDQIVVKKQMNPTVEYIEASMNPEVVPDDAPPIVINGETGEVLSGEQPSTAPQSATEPPSQHIDSLPPDDEPYPLTLRDVWPSVANELLTMKVSELPEGLNVGGIIYSQIKSLGYPSSEAVKQTLGLESLKDWKGTLEQLMVCVLDHASEFANES